MNTFPTFVLMFLLYGGCFILNRWTNNKKLVDIYKYNLFFYSSTVTIVCSRNTIRESSHISSFCGGGPFSEVGWQLENTHNGADSSAWVTSGSLPLLERPADLSLRLSDQWISAFSPKLQTFYCLSSPMWKYEHPLHLTYFFCLWLVTLVYKNKFLVWGKNEDRCFLLIWVCWIQIYK